MQKKWIIGLGNPGKKYETTRHNAGFMAVSRLAADLGFPLDREKRQSLYGQGVVDGVQLTLILPQTFMNLSGASAAEWRRDGLEPGSDLLVLYDDMDLPLGKLRFRTKGSAGSHNGMASLIEHLGGGEFHRLRLGIGKPEDPALWADYVTQKFHPAERPTVKDMLERAARGARQWIRSAPNETLMAELNR